VQLADDDGDAVADAAVVDEAREGAEGEVNTYLAPRYRVPIDLGVYPELSGLIKAVVLDVAEFRLRTRRPPVAEDARRRYEQTVEWLKRIADGVVVLPALTQLASPTNRGLHAAVRGETRVLSHDELAGH
jgi:phage gp36-like protein